MAKGTEPDVDGDGKVEFGEGLPDAAIFKATVDEFDRQARALHADAESFEPTPSDAFTAITIMTPTMSEYFEAWKNSRFIAGEGATEQAFVAASRLQDIADILEGIVFTYDSVAAAGRRARTRSRRSRPSASWTSCSPSSPTSATARRPASSSPPSRPTRSAPRPRPRPRRSPAR